MAKKKKPEGFGKFNALAKLLVQVPRAEVDAQIAAKPNRMARQVIRYHFFLCGKMQGHKS